jgi:hypothetical protein
MASYDRWSHFVGTAKSAKNQRGILPGDLESANLRSRILWAQNSGRVVLLKASSGRPGHSLRLGDLFCFGNLIQIEAESHRMKHLPGSHE